MLQIGVFFLSSTSRVVCYRMIDWKKTLSFLELLNEKALNFLRVPAQEP